MANILEKLKNMVMGDNYDDEDEYDDEYDDLDYEEEPVKQRSNVSPIRQSYINPSVSSTSRRSGMHSKVVSINTNVNMQVVVATPENLEEAAEVCEDLKDKKTVVVNLETVEHETAQRITDFLCGASYALDGSIQLVSNEIFIIGPVNVDITGQFKEELKASGIKLPYTSLWK